MKHLLTFLIIVLFTYAPITHSNTPNTNFSSSLDYAQVVQVNATQSSDGTWCFNTSVRHNDTSWKHYADGWAIFDLNNKQLGYRLLAHPHVNEQPFTRSLCNISIPNTVAKIVIKAKCNQHGFGGKAIIVDLNTSKGAGYSVSR